MGGHPPQVIDHPGMHYSNQQDYNNEMGDGQHSHHDSPQYHSTGMGPC